MGRIIMVTGGQRSGKSLFAEKKTLELSSSPFYLATSRIWDDEFRQRVSIHQARRNDQWTTIEEEKYLSQHSWNGKTVLLDCVTLWLTNFFCDNEFDKHKALQEATQEWEQLMLQKEVTWVIVTNEIGLGGISAETSSRNFCDLQGSMNQIIAQSADEVYWVISGIPVKIKG